jgi:hypothetical protein
MYSCTVMAWIGQVVVENATMPVKYYIQNTELITETSLISTEQLVYLYME